MPTAEKRSPDERRQQNEEWGQSALYGDRTLRDRLHEIKTAAEQALSEIEKRESEGGWLGSGAAEVGIAFKESADQLLATVEATLAEMRAQREETGSSLTAWTNEWRRMARGSPEDKLAVREELERAQRNRRG